MLPLFKNKFDGFTLIEILVVIAIIGLLAIIAIPNYIAYRQHSFCTAVEKDAFHLSIAVHSYFGVPSHNTLAGITPDQVGFHGFSGFGSQMNTATITGALDNIIIQVTDGSGQCPGNRPGWSGSVYTKILN